MSPVDLPSSVIVRTGLTGQFKVNHVTVEIDNMTWKIRDSKHDILYKFLKATATGIIKKAIQAAVKVALTNALEEGNSQLAQVRNTAAEARKSNETNQREAIKELYKRKAEKAEREKEAAKVSRVSRI